MIRPAILCRVILVTLLSGALTAAGHAQVPDAPATQAAVRSGNHPGFGRLVIDTSGTATYQIDQDGDHVVVHFANDVKLADPPAFPRNVISLASNGSTIDLILKHGAKVRPMRLAGRLVIDVLDAPDNAAPPAKDRPAGVLPGLRRQPMPSMASSPELGGRSPAAHASSAPPVAVQPLPAIQPGPPQSPLVPPAPPAEPKPPIIPQTIEATQPTSPGRDVLPENEGSAGLLARRVKLPPEFDGSAILVPFEAAAGAAAFRGADGVFVVFDERRPVDMSALQTDPLFGAASVQLLPGGTLLRIPMASALSVALTQLPQGWRIAVLTAAPKQQPIVATFADGRLSLAAEQTSDVVNLADPDTGATLLVGTQHRSGQGIVNSRAGTEFILRPTIQGVVVEPLSDAITLKPGPKGFSMTGGPAGLLLSPPAIATDGLMDAALLSTRFAFATIPVDALMRRSIRQVDAAAASPPLARGIQHHLLAETLLALGLGAEAESLLKMAAEQDPKEAASADTAALTAIAALLAGRVDESDALADPRLDGTDEISLWRAVRIALQDKGSPQAAAVFATTAPLVFRYPAPIRDHVLPLITETMIEGGEVGPAAHLLDQRKDDPKLAYARALMLQAQGNTKEALRQLDALANGRDRFDRARAAVRAVEIRLAERKLDSNQAADALDKLLYAWRGDARELALRERVADLRAQSGMWPQALAMLRQTETDFPDQAASVHQRLKDTFAEMIRDRGAQQMSPIDFVAMVDENADLMLDAGDNETLQQSLADRFLALDLPDRAEPVLEKLMRSAKSDGSKARFGASLATLQTRDGNDAGARATLDASEGHDLPPDLVEQRLVLRAGAVARGGDVAAATAMLAPLHTARATEARAQILENASDWAGAEQAWSDCVALTLPDTGMLDEPQTRTLLRLATAAARAGDEAALADLRTKYANRIATSPLGDMFRLLTVEPIRTTADIGRSQQEVSLAASIPAGLKALQRR